MRQTTITADMAKKFVEYNIYTKGGSGLKIGHVTEIKETDDDDWPFRCHMQLIQEFGADYYLTCENG